MRKLLCKLLCKIFFIRNTTNKTKRWYKQKNKWYRYTKNNCQPEIIYYPAIRTYSFNYWYYNELKTRL